MTAPADQELREVPATDQVIRGGGAVNQDPEPSAAGPSARPPSGVAGACMTRDPAVGGQAARTEADLGDVRQWHELARHLVQGHGGEPNGLISNGLTLDQLRFAHADTHQALALIGAGPPDGHAHPGPAHSGDPVARLASYLPVPALAECAGR